VFSSNYSLYGDISRRVMRILKYLVPNIEIYSIDEAFLDLSSIPNNMIPSFGKKVRDTILQWTGIPTSIGIAKTKTLSKIANHIAKKQKSGIVNLIGIENIDSILEKIKINDIWGVGRQASKFYIKHGINNAKQLKDISNNWIKNNSNVLASRIAMELRGISCIDLETYQAKRKSCCVSRSFGEKVENFQILAESIVSHSLNAAEKIRSESLLAKAITIFIRTSLFQNKKIFYSNSKTIDFPIATDNSIEIVKNALGGLKSIFKKGYKYQKTGIILSRFLDSEKTHNLFFSSKEKRIKSLMKSIDYTNYRYGRSTLTLADAGLNKERNIGKKYFSKIDTANFDYLPIVKVN
jgi:DNA polymerase V